MTFGVYFPWKSVHDGNILSHLIDSIYDNLFACMTVGWPMTRIAPGKQATWPDSAMECCDSPRKKVMLPITFGLGLSGGSSGLS